MWQYHVKCNSKNLLIGKTVVITGGNSGIGKETAKDFYKRGAKVIIACRNMIKAEKAIEKIKKECDSMFNHLDTIDCVHLDLNSLELTRQCATQILNQVNRIDILVNNAGITISNTRYTNDNFESHFGVNHLGHFLFTLLLLPRIIESAPARIIFISALSHIFSDINFEDLNFRNTSYNTLHQIRAYLQSKLGNVIIAKELARKLKLHGIEGVNTYSLHPGLIYTDIGRNLDVAIPGAKLGFKYILRPFIKNAKQGAQTTIYCAVSDETKNETGLYYSDCKVKTPSRAAQNIETAKNFWDISVKLAGLEDYDPFVKHCALQENKNVKIEEVTKF